MDEATQEDSLQTAHSLMTEYLHQRCLRVTPERRAMVDAAFQLEGHFTVEDMNRFLQEQHFRVSLATLYNNMDMLVDTGILTRHCFGSVAMYERRLGMEPHFHRICKVCGDVKDMVNPRWMHVTQQTTVRGFKFDFYQFYAFGICGKCASALRRKNKKAIKK